MMCSVSRTISVIVLTVLLVAAPGCVRYIKIPERYPMYTLLDKEELQAEREKLIVTKAELEPLTAETREKVLKIVASYKSEAAYMRTLLEKYNAYAEVKNDDFNRYMNGR